MNRNELLNELHEMVCVVEFVKQNGEHRRMECTLLKDFMPERVATGDVRERPAHLMSVWDTEKNAFRSINLDTVKAVNGNKVDGIQY